MFRLLAELIRSEAHRAASHDDSDHRANDDASRAVDQAKPKKRWDQAGHKAARRQNNGKGIVSDVLHGCWLLRFLLIPKPVDPLLEFILSPPRIDRSCVQRFVTENLSQSDEVIARLRQVPMSEAVP